MIGWGQIVGRLLPSVVGAIHYKTMPLNIRAENVNRATVVLSARFPNVPQYFRHEHPSRDIFADEFFI